MLVKKRRSLNWQATLFPNYSISLIKKDKLKFHKISNDLQKKYKKLNSMLQACLNKSIFWKVLLCVLKLAKKYFKNLKFYNHNKALLNWYSFYKLTNKILLCYKFLNYMRLQNKQSAKKISWTRAKTKQVYFLL
jgi:hypothetical protein